MKATILCILCFTASIVFAQRASRASFDSSYSKSLEAEIRQKLAATLANQTTQFGFSPGASDSIDQAIRSSLGAVLKPAVGRTYNVTARTGILPITFSKLEKNGTTFSLGKSVTLGAGVGWIWGQASYKDSKTINIQPDFFLGVGVDVGPRVNDQSKLNCALGVSGYIGFEKVGISVGRDFINSVYLVGIATTIDLSSLNVANTTVTSISEIIRPNE